MFSRNKILQIKSLVNYKLQYRYNLKEKKIAFIYEKKKKNYSLPFEVTLRKENDQVSLLHCIKRIWRVDSTL